MNLTITERVARGASHLDSLMPGWRDKIDVLELNIESTRRCVLGQLYLDEHPEAEMFWCEDEFYEYFDLKRHHDDAKYLGFDVPVGGAEQYPALTAEWKKELVRG